MGDHGLNAEHFHARLMYFMLILGIITFITSIISAYKYSLIVYWIVTDSPIINPIHPSLYNWFLIVNLVQRVPLAFLWVFLFVTLVRFEHKTGDKSLHSPLYLAGFIMGLSFISILYFSLALNSLIDVNYYSLLGSLESDFFLLTIINILELLLWIRLRSYMEISPFINKKRSKRVRFGFILLIMAVSASLVLKVLFISDEVHIFGDPYNNYYLYYSLIFGACAVLESFKSVLYLIGGLFTGIHRRKRSTGNNFVHTGLKA